MVVAPVALNDGNSQKNVKIVHVTLVLTLIIRSKSIGHEISIGIAVFRLAKPIGVVLVFSYLQPFDWNLNVGLNLSTLRFGIVLTKYDWFSY